jgi:hypothetical protein
MPATTTTTATPVVAAAADISAAAPPIAPEVEAIPATKTNLIALLGAKVKFVDGKLSAGLRPTPVQTAHFLRELVTALRPFVATVPQPLSVIRAELQQLGWDVGKNQPTSAAPPNAEDLLASLRRAIAHIGHGQGL